MACAAPSRLAVCYGLREVRLRPPDIATLARTGRGRAGTLVFVRTRLYTTEPVFGRCTARGIDACMGPRPVIRRRVVRGVEHAVIPGSAELRGAPFDRVRGAGPWPAPEGRPWPAAPSPGSPYDEAPLLARTSASSPPAERFAAWVDLVSARLATGDVAGARAAFDQAVALAPELSGAAFFAPDPSRTVTAADADSVADGPDPAPVRHARLRAMIGANAFRTPGDLNRATERARALRAPLPPVARDARVFFRGEDPMVYAHEVLGALAWLLHQRWADPCAAPAPGAP